MSISAATVRHIAQLARLGIDDAQLPVVAAELEQILNFVDQLKMAEITDVEPLAHPLEVALSLRPDNVSETDQRDAFLALAPEAQSGLYLVPKVIE